MVGEIRLFAGKVPPKRWLFCDGQWVDKTAYSTLYEVIGDNFGYRPVDLTKWVEKEAPYDPDDPNTWHGYEYESDPSDWEWERETKPGKFKLPDLKSPMVDFWGRLKPIIKPGQIDVPGYSKPFPNWSVHERVEAHLRRVNDVRYIIRYEDDPIDTKKHRNFFNMMYDLRLRNRHTT